MKLLLTVLLLLFLPPLAAYDSIEMELSNGSYMSLNRFEGAGKTLLLWLPSERGLGQGYIPVALDLAALDYDVWSANLHETYMVPGGRDSLDEVEIEDLLALIEASQDQGFDELYLVSSGRGMQLALQAAYLWQQQNPQSNLIKGMLTFSPHLIKGRTEMGQDAEYLKIAAYSNLPVYMLQAQYSTKFARSWEIAQQLEQGGSQVFIHFLQGVQGGFHMRPVEDLTKTDLAMREQLPQIFERAMNLLRQINLASLVPGYRIDLDSHDIPQAWIKLPRLHPYQGDKQPAPLVLEDLNGNSFNLDTLKGQVVLVNFWATWCPPCVEEIPSLSRLVERMNGKPFKVVAVNIGESPQQIQQFLQAIPVNFDILLDRHGHSVRDWKVYAYPSNYLLDQQGLIQYSYRGALEWDAPSIVQTIEQLL